MDGEKKTNSKPEEDTSVHKYDKGDVQGDSELEHHLKDIHIANLSLGSEVYCRPNTLEQQKYLEEYQRKKSKELIFNLLAVCFKVRKELDTPPYSLPETTRRTIINYLCMLEKECTKEKLSKEDFYEIMDVLNKLLATFDNNSTKEIRKIQDLCDDLLKTFLISHIDF